MTARSTIVLALVVLTSGIGACAGGSGGVEVPGASQTRSSTAPTEITTTVAADSSTTIEPTTTVESTTTLPPTTAVPATSGAPVTTAERAVVLLRQGDEGPRVTAIQRKLVTLGYLPRGSATGVFDSSTNTAVLGFQADYGLVVDGLVGPETERSISAAANSINSG